ncbi:MAG TPA: hypothetical protein VM689_07105, partial [Aliidongia sp.]|nr:hypothetical protein [Aliidongia sp.]
MGLALTAMPHQAVYAADGNATLKAQIDALSAQVKALAAHDQAQGAEIKALTDQLQQLQTPPAATAPP